MKTYYSYSFLLRYGGAVAVCGFGFFCIGYLSALLKMVAEAYARRRALVYEFRKVHPPNHAWREDKEIVELAHQTTPAVVCILVKYDDARFHRLGTGFFVGEEGLILTCAHVVGVRKIVAVITDDCKSFEGVVLSSDVKRDLALVRIQLAEGKFPIIKLGNSDGVKKNDFVMSFGHPDDGMKCCGEIGSVLGGTLLSYSRHRPIISTVSTRPGFSGGPLIDRNGEALGVNFGGMGKPPSTISISKPSNEAKKFLDEVKKKELFRNGKSNKSGSLEAAVNLFTWINEKFFLCMKTAALRIVLSSSYFANLVQTPI